MHDFCIMVRQRWRSATDHQLNASMKWLRPPKCWTASTAPTKRFQRSLSCLDKCSTTRQSGRPFCFMFLTLSLSVRVCDRQVHLTKIVKMPSIVIWYKQWRCNLVYKLWIPNIIYMRCGFIIALSIGDLQGGGHLRWDRLIVILSKNWVKNCSYTFGR